MSTTAHNYRTQTESVMVRGHEDRAYRVTPLDFDGRIVGVTGSDVNHAIGYLRHCVYLFDSKLFKSLSSELSPERRSRLWKSASPFDATVLPRSLVNGGDIGGE